ncbi:MAG TPA: hypothetical protein VMU68_07170 [Acidimicrobiales bacterium]|nr:hypothetical protein [Acidimicrobiales bacterium]
MNEFEDRLRAADPVAANSYQHPDTNAMISRIMAQVPRARRHVLRSFQIRMAGSVALAAALTVGGIAALEGAAPSLAVFSLAAASPSASPHRGSLAPKASAGFSTALPMRILEEYDFSAGPDLSTNAGSGAAYELQLPTSASAEAARIATVFGMSGTPVDSQNDGHDFTVTDPSGSYVQYQSYDAVPQWTYSVALPQATSTTTSDGATVAMPNQSTIESDVQKYLDRLGYGFQVTDPQFSTSNNVMSSPGQASVTTNDEQASYSVTVDGQMTDQYFEFTVDQYNDVVYASGPAFNVMPAVNYPLQSPVAGVGVLEAQQQSEFAANGSSGQSSGIQSSTSTSTPSPSNSSSSTSPSTSDTSDTTTTTTTTIPIVAVTLDAESVSYQTYQLTDASVWMLPIYNYTGDVNGDNGSSYTGTWSVIAVDPAYIHISTSSSGGIHPGGPIVY